MTNRLDTIVAHVDAELERAGIHAGYARLAGHLPLEAIMTPATLCFSARSCASGFWHRRDTQAFMSAPWANAARLADRVLSGAYRPRSYPARTICERGKMRRIEPPSFESKVVQKALCSLVVRPVLVHHMVTTSYAGIPGRGCDKMWADIERALNRAMRSGAPKAVVMTDYHDYFGSLPTRPLLESMGRWIDGRGLMETIARFFPREHGASLGNELSQVPASFYPSPVDHFVKDRLGLPWFRYMDDTLGICDASDAPALVSEHQRLAAELGLVLPDGKVSVVRLGKPFRFCKELFVYDRQKKRYVRLANPTREATERRRMRAIAARVMEGELETGALKSQVRCVMGTLASHPRTWCARSRLSAEHESLLARITSSKGADGRRTS